jgi:hypothetical protein
MFVYNDVIHGNLTEACDSQSTQCFSGLLKVLELQNGLIAQSKGLKERMIETQLRSEVNRWENVVVAKRGGVPDAAAPCSPAWETYRAALPETAQ